MFPASCRLSAPATVEEDPPGKVGGKLFETMGLARRNKQKRTYVDRMTTLAIVEYAAPAGDNVDLVA